jgi:hypothetical protein
MVYFISVIRLKMFDQIMYWSNQVQKFYEKPESLIEKRPNYGVKAPDFIMSKSIYQVKLLLQPYSAYLPLHLKKLRIHIKTQVGKL